MAVNKKRLMIICSCSLAVILLSAGVTLAYLGTAKKKENKVTVGKGDVSITESTWSEPEIQLMENTTPKDVKVTNTGTVPCFVRVFMDFSDSEAVDFAKVQATNYFYYKWDVFTTELKADPNTVSKNWVFVESDTTNHNLDGYFYYTKPIAPEKSTDALILAVKTDFNGINNYDTNIDKIKAFDIIVYSETVQTIGTDGTDYGAANAWQTAWEEFLK